MVIIIVSPYKWSEAMLDIDYKEFLFNHARSVYMRHLNGLSKWLGQREMFPAVLYPTLLTILEHEDAEILENVAMVYERGEPPTFFCFHTEQAITMCFDVIPGESWQDVRRFFSSISYDNSPRPYLSWIYRQTETTYQIEISNRIYVERPNWLAHWVFLVRPFRSEPSKVLFQVALSIAGRNDKRLPKVHLYVHSDSLLNPEEFKSLEAARTGASNLLLRSSRPWWQIWKK